MSETDPDPYPDDAGPDPWADLADDIRRDADRRHHFEPAAGCRCASCLERRGYAEQAEVWQARATQAEARVAELEEAIDDALLLLAGGAPTVAATGLRMALARPAGEPDHA